MESVDGVRLQEDTEASYNNGIVESEVDGPKGMMIYLRESLHKLLIINNKQFLCFKGMKYTLTYNMCTRVCYCYNIVTADQIFDEKDFHSDSRRKDKSTTTLSKPTTGREETVVNNAPFFPINPQGNIVTLYN